MEESFMKTDSAGQIFGTGRGGHDSFYKKKRQKNKKKKNKS